MRYTVTVAGNSSPPKRIETTIWCGVAPATVPNPNRWGRNKSLDELLVELPQIICYFNKTVHGMILYILQVSNTKPVQYRISVIERPAHSGALMPIIGDPGFETIGAYDTADAAMDVLTPYLRMEDGK